MSGQAVERCPVPYLSARGCSLTVWSWVVVEGVVGLPPDPRRCTVLTVLPGRFYSRHGGIQGCSAGCKRHSEVIVPDTAARCERPEWPGRY